jgi:hypothetical protein
MSNVQRRKLSRALWNKFRELGGYEIDIEADHLGKRYEVNKFGFYVRGEEDTLKSIRKRLVTRLQTEEEFTVVIDEKLRTVTVSRSDRQAYAVIGDVFGTPHEGEFVISIGVYL